VATDMLLMIVRLHQGHSMIFNTGCSKKVFILFFFSFLSNCLEFQS